MGLFYPQFEILYCGFSQFLLKSEKYWVDLYIHSLGEGRSCGFDYWKFSSHIF